MAQSITVIYPGTFDPIHLGHEDIIRRAAALFGAVIVAVAMAHHKKTLFSLEERLAMARDAVAQWPHVRVEPFDGLVTQFALQQGAQVMVRGVRSATDLAYEHQLADMNRKLAPAVDTIFFTPDSRWQSISSTLVREIALLGGDAAQFVAPSVWDRLQAKRKV